MNNDIASGLRRARDLREHGRYVDAVGELEGLLKRFENDVELAVELGETLLIQGYFKRAAEVLAEHMAHFDERNNLTAAAGNIICCFARVYATCRFKECLHHVEKIYHDFLSSESSQIVNDTTVRIETYYCKFWKLASTFGGIDYTHILPTCLSRLRAAFDTLLKRTDFSNALKVARAYFNCNDGSDAASLTETLLSNQQTPALYRAEAQFLMAKKLVSPNQRKEQEQLYTKALQSFESVGHNHGVLDIEIARLCRKPLDPDDNTFKETLTRLLKAYEVLDHPAGLGFALLEFLSLAKGANDFESQNLILNNLERMFPASSSRFLWLMTSFSQLTMWLLSGDLGKVLHGATALWTDLVHSDCSLTRGQTAIIASQAYHALEDHKMAAKWSNRAQRDLPGTNFTAIPSLAKEFDLTHPDSLSQYYERTVKLVDLDTANGSPGEAVEILGVFLNQALKVSNKTIESFDIIDRALSLYEENIRSLTDRKLVPRRLAHLRQNQASLLVMKSISRPDAQLEMDAIDALNEAKKLYLEEKLLGHAAIVLQHQALAYLGVFQKFEWWNDTPAQQALETALNLYRVALDSTTDLGLVLLSRENAYWVALCKFRQWKRGWCSHETLLNSLLSAESFVDQQRLEISVLQGMEAIVTKRRLASNENVRNIYRFAIHVCYCHGFVQEAWTWTQKSKARSLSDLLGLGILIPQELMDKIERNEATRLLFEEERKLVEDLSTKSDIERVQMRILLERHQKNMRKHDSLAELLNLREGVPVTIGEISDIARGKRRTRAMIFVDWVITEFGISVYIVTADGELKLRELPITAEGIQDWISKHLDGGNDPTATEDECPLSGVKEDDEADEGPLRYLDVLVAPLSELSDPNDLLIFCPSGILHSLPLHALRVGPVGEREILIVRNPIIYCASLTSFVQCCRRAAEDPTKNVMKNRRILAVYEPWPGDQHENEKFSTEERRHVYSSIKSLAENIRGEPLCGKDVTFGVLKECLEESLLVHFHGHCDSDAGIIAEQSLRISNIGGAAASVTVQDLFSFRIKASHVSLLACSSASQHFEAGDEPLGLVTALLSAGTSSVLGTLWPVQSRTARMFSERFYSHLQKPGRDKYGVYDLAYAVREAVVDVMHPWELRHPFHWASFVLHGAWFLNGEI